MLLILACIFSSVLLSNLGCLMVWNRYTYLTDSILHVLLLAAVLHGISEIPLEWCSCFVSILFVATSSYLQKHFQDHSLVLSVATTSIIAFSIVIAESMNIDLDIEGILFGDLLLTNAREVAMLGVCMLFSLILIFSKFETIVISALNEDIAASLGINILRWRVILLCFAAFNISMVVKIVGGLMVGSLCIVPVFFARLISNTPQKMLVCAAIFSLILNLLGLKLAFLLNFSVAATICIAQVMGLFLTLLGKKYIL